MTWTDQALLFTPILHDLVQDAAFGLIDCGARENIPEPWASLEVFGQNRVRVLGFEADGAEAHRLNATFANNRRYVAAAAWDQAGRRHLNVTNPPQASSVFAPNETLADLYTHGPDGWRSLPNGRVTQRAVEVPTTTIDAALSEYPFDADVLKIDTQGAEYEILEGATQTLARALFAVTAETWTVEVYKGVRPMWEVMSLMSARGFTLMAQEPAGYARRHFGDAATTAFIQREQLISMELLFFRDAAALTASAGAPAKIYKAVAVADIYGFADYGVDLLRRLLVRWPGEIGNVKRCYDEIVKRRSGLNVSGATYPKLNGHSFFSFGADKNKSAKE